MSLNDPPVTILCPANPPSASPVSFTFSASWVAVISSSLLNVTAVPSCLLRVVFDFIKFVKNDNRKEYIQSLNEAVQKMLSYKRRNKSKIILDVTDYKEHSNLKYDNRKDITDSEIEEILSNRLSYTENLEAWIVRRN